MERAGPGSRAGPCVSGRAPWIRYRYRYRSPNRSPGDRRPISHGQGQLAYLFLSTPIPISISIAMPHPTSRESDEYLMLDCSFQDENMSPAEARRAQSLPVLRLHPGNTGHRTRMIRKIAPHRGALQKRHARSLWRADGLPFEAASAKNGPRPPNARGQSRHAVARYRSRIAPLLSLIAQRPAAVC